MSRFLRGLVVAVVISLFTALTIALTRSKKLRQELGKRIEVLRNALPESKQLKQFAQQAGTKVQESRNILSNLIPQSARRVMQRRQKGESNVHKAEKLVDRHDHESSDKSDSDVLNTLVTTKVE